MDKMREDFEVWSEDRRSELSRWKRGPLAGRYKNPVVETMWEAWQASRKALVVKLPTWHGYDDCDISGASSAIGDCADAIRAAGITVKGGDQ